jgi:hypothetical protein
MAQDWKFQDPPNVAVLATRSVLDGDWVHSVFHHVDDGAWEFHAMGEVNPDTNMCVVSLATVVELDPTIAELCDLPFGWCAWRESISAPWQRQQMD